MSCFFRRTFLYSSYLYSSLQGVNGSITTLYLLQIVFLGAVQNTRVIFRYYWPTS